jgi:hypothetical protein
MFSQVCVGTQTWWRDNERGLTSTTILWSGTIGDTVISWIAKFGDTESEDWILSQKLLFIVRNEAHFFADETME